jgi:autotransporter passenger strand-loop-strand repeat protein
MADINFSQDNINMLGLPGGGTYNKVWDLFSIDQNLNKSIDLGGSLLGAGADLFAHVSASLTATLNLDIGSVQLDYGLTVPDAAATVFDNVTPDWNTLGYTYSSGNLTPTAGVFANNNFSVDLNYDVSGGIAGAHVSVLGFTVGQSDLGLADPLSVGTSGTLHLFGVGGGDPPSLSLDGLLGGSIGDRTVVVNGQPVKIPSQLSLPQEVPGGVGGRQTGADGVSVGWDGVVTSGAPALPSISINGDAPNFLQLNFDIIKALAQEFPVLQALDGTFGDSSTNISWALVKLFASAGVQLSQNLAFNPNPVQVELQTSTGQDIVGNLGDDFTFDTPQGAGDLTVTPTYTLSGDYVSTVGVKFDGGISLDLLEATIHNDRGAGFPLHLGIDQTFGPLLSVGASASTNRIDLATNDLPVTFAPIQGSSFVIHYVKNFVGDPADVNRAIDLTITNQIFFQGNGGSEIITGNDLGDVITTGSGNVSFTGGAGDDTVFVGTGSDTLTGGAGNNTFVFGAAASYADVIAGAGASPGSAAPGDVNTIEVTGEGGTYDFRSSTISDITTVKFNANLNPTVELDASQFGPGYISTALAVTADSNVDNVTIVDDLSSGSFDASNFTFGDQWTASDQLTIDASANPVNNLSILAPTVGSTIIGNATDKVILPGNSYTDTPITNGNQFSGYGQVYTVYGISQVSFGNSGVEEIAAGLTASNITVDPNDPSIVPQLLLLNVLGTTSDTRVNNAGHEVVEGGGLAVHTVVNAGGLETVSGGTASGTTVKKSGIQSVTNGGFAVDTLVHGGEEDVAAFAGVSNTTVNGGGSVYVSLGAVADNTSVGAGGHLYIGGGAGYASATRITNGGVEHVGGLFSQDHNAFILGGGQQIVENGGTAYDTLVDESQVRLSGLIFVTSSGFQTVSAGGRVVNATLTGGEQDVYGGEADNTTINFGTENVASGGVTSFTSVGSGFAENVLKGGTANNTSVTGTLNVYGGGTANAAMVNSGGKEIIAGVNFEVASDFGATISSGGVQDVMGNGVANGVATGLGFTFQQGTGTTVLFGGFQEIFDGGTANATTLLGGTQLVHKYANTVQTDIVFGEADVLGAARLTTIGAGGIEKVSGFDIQATIDAGGYQEVLGKGEAVFAAVYGTSLISVSGTSDLGGPPGGIPRFPSKGQQIIDAGADSQDTTLIGGEQDVFGLARQTTILAGGIEKVYGRDRLASVFLGGEQDVESGGVATNDTLFSASSPPGSPPTITIGLVGPALQMVLAGGTALGTTLSGGELDVESLGAASLATIESGGVEEVFGTDGKVTINFGGVQHVEAGGFAGSATVTAGGTQFVESGGVAASTAITGGGHQVVRAGGIAQHTTLGLGDTETIFNGGFGSVDLLDGSTLKFTVNAVDQSAPLVLKGGGNSQFVTIGGFNLGDTIDLVGVRFDRNGSVNFLPNSVLQVTEFGHTTYLHFDPSQSSFYSQHFALSGDGAGGTIVRVIEPATWAQGTNGNWGNATKWSPQIVPGAFAEALVTARGKYTVTSSATRTVFDLQTASGATLNVSSGTFHLIDGTGPGVNAGAIKLTGASTLISDGVINNATSGVVAALTSGTLIDLRGGDIVGGGISIVSGAVLRTDAGKDLPSTISGATIADGGTLLATGNTTLTLLNTKVNAGPGGVIEASKSTAPGQSVIRLDGATISGGTLKTTDTSTIETVSGGTGSTLNGVAIAAGSTVTVVDNSRLVLEGTIRDRLGTIFLDSTGDATDLLISGNVTLSGNGRVALSDDAHNAIFAANNAPATLTNGNVIFGAGQIGAGDGNLALINQGTVDANTVNALVIDTGNQVSNTRLLEATGAGGLMIDDALNNTGTIEAQGGNVTIAASLSTTNTGVLEAVGASTLEIDDTVNNAVLDQAASKLRTGLVSAASAGATVDLAGGNIEGGEANIAAGATMEATGGPTSSSTLTFVTMTDNGTLLATDNATLTLKLMTVNAIGGGTVAARNTSYGGTAKIVLDKATIKGGTLDEDKGGVIETATGDFGTDNVLNGVTITGACTLSVVDLSTAALTGTIANSGRIDLNGADHGANPSGFDITRLVIDGNVTLTGFGNVTLADTNTNAIQSLSSVIGIGGKVTLVNASNTISGAGEIGKSGDGNLGFSNKGTVDATGVNALTIDTGNTVANSGTLEASGAGGLLIDDAVKNTGIIAAQGGNVKIGGSLSGAGTAEIFGFSTMEFAGAASNGVIFENQNSGMLKLDASETFTGTVAGLGKGDSIDLADFKFSGNPSVINTTTTTKAGITTTDVTVRDGLQSVVLHLASAIAGAFPANSAAYSLSADSSANPGTLFQLAPPPVH